MSTPKRCRVCNRKTKKAPQIYTPHYCSGQCYDKYLEEANGRK